MKLKRIWKVIITLSLLLIIIIIFGISIYNYELSPVDKKNKTDVVITIKKGTSTQNIIKSLKKADLIRSEGAVLVYLKLNKVGGLQASSYKLNRAMSSKEIIKIINSGKGFNPDEVTITFKEGKNMRSIAKVISKNTNNKYDAVISKSNDKDYINRLATKYWFIDKDVQKDGTFYKLEGYLYPNTYVFKNKNVTIEDIFNKMLIETDKVLSKYKTEIEKSKLSTQQIITLSSIVELEGLSDKDRPNIASVFYNRLNKNMSLGSDVTACYAQKIDDTTLCHKTANFNYKSDYNTRLVSKLGLPTGPICNPSESSIKAVLNAPKTDYLYFVADKDTNVYFFKTKDEFDKKIKELKQNGKWL